MNPRLRLAVVLLAAAAALPAARGQDAAPPAGGTPPPSVLQEIPRAAPRAPLPPEPKDAVKKPVQGLLKRWFENEPKIPVKGKTEAEVKGERARVVGEMETEILKVPGLLRMTAWWRARLQETQPSENRPTGIRAKEEFAYGEGDRRKTFTFAVSVPPSYRGKGTDLLPVIVTVLDKEADPKKVLPAAYGRLLDTHLVVASYENAVPTAGVMLNAIYFAFLNYRCDRERLVLDGIGRGARFVEELAAAEYSALQWCGAVIRTPAAVQRLEGNLGLFPVAVVDPGEAGKAAASAHVAAGGPGVLLPAGDAAKVQDFISGLGPRPAGDQAGSYTAWFQSTGRMPKWGLWFLVNQAVDGDPALPVRVKISRDPSLNAVDIDATNLAEGTLLLNDDVLDLDQTVSVRVNGIVVAREKPVRTFKHTFDWSLGYATFLLGPRDYFVTAVIPFVVEGEARVPLADRIAAAEAEKRAAEDRRKQEEADRLAAEAAKKAEEEAKNPPPAPAGENPPPAPAGENPPPAPSGENPPAAPAAPGAPLETAYFSDIAEARASTRGRPVLVVFRAPADDARQISLNTAFSSEDGKKALAVLDILLVPPADAGDGGRATRDLLAELSGSPAAAPPLLAVLGGKATLPLADLSKEEEILAAVVKFLVGAAPPGKEPPPAPAPDPAGPAK